MLRIDASLHFVSSQGLEDRLRELAEEPDTHYHTAVLDFEGVNYIDSQGSATIAEILELSESYGADIRLTRVKPQVLGMLRRDGILDRLGEEKVFGNVYNAVVDKLPDDAKA